MVGNVSNFARNSLIFRRNLRGEIQDKSGFTLIEVLVVLMIIGLIMSLAGPKVMGYFSDSKFKSAKIQVEALSGSLELFHLDNGRYPTASEGLQALVLRPTALTNWNGPYLKNGAVPSDPWGKPYKYTVTDKGRNYSLTFVSPDGQEVGGPQKSLSSLVR